MASAFLSLLLLRKQRKAEKVRFAEVPQLFGDKISLELKSQKLEFLPVHLHFSALLVKFTLLLEKNACRRMRVLQS